MATDIPSKPIESGDGIEELAGTFDRARSELKRLVQARLDRRLHGRVDASDILQDAYLTAFQRYGEYVKSPDVPLVEWLRFLTIQSVLAAHRFHFGRIKRSVSREVGQACSDSAVAIVELIASEMTNVDSIVSRNELQQLVQEVISTMDAIDREIIRMRHEDMLSNQECADRMGITNSAASKRYIRALKKLKSIVDVVV
jgi:RNA polymerase sigma-70 factor (ECF subfamily)